MHWLETEKENVADDLEMPEKKTAVAAARVNTRKTKVETDGHWSQVHLGLGW